MPESSPSDQLRFVGVSLDCADSDELAAFYVGLLGGRLLWSEERSAAVQVPGLLLVLQRVPDYQPPVWPGTSIVHLDLSAGEKLAEPEQRALSLGATRAEPQPDPRWRVLLDPAGHPFCITTLAPPPELLESAYGR
ncbi:VOC family protein [Prauserella endophytica]|uniref:VOC family protein n=1 Tax=Prauserella endophytica TaxID=1592324 RepID=UPI001E637A41|nr:VOC family protein [Prauserella endophytica]